MTMTTGFRVPDVDLSSAQVPVAFSSFTASNGTSLDAITPEVGPAWVEQEEDWDIQANRANSTGAGSHWVATIASSDSDVLIRSIINTPSVSTSSILLRYTDINNFWLVGIDVTSDSVSIWERNGGTYTQRASTSVTINASTDYNVLAILDAATITGFVDNGNRVNYASATLNQTSKIHGIRGQVSGITWDNFTIYPRRASAYNVLDTI